MNDTLVVVADLGCFKAYRVQNNHIHRPPRLELIEQLENPSAHDRLVDKVSDLGGRFPKGAGRNSGGAMSDGERHNIELESRKRLVRRMAERLNTLIAPKEIERCFLAASVEINHQLVELLAPPVRAKIQKNLQADLTKIANNEILPRF